MGVIRLLGVIGGIGSRGVGFGVRNRGQEGDRRRKSVCKALGFNDGQHTQTRKTYNVDAMPVGKCKSGEPLDECTDGGNGFSNLDHNGGYCKQGNEIGVEVVCTGE